MSALIEPVDLEAGAVFLSAPTATALYEKYVHVRSTIATARRTGSGRTSDTQAGLTGCRTFFENIVVDRIHSAKRLGLKIGVASSSRHEWVDTHLTRLGLIDYFDSIKCFDDVKRTKPDPELYLAVLDALGVHGQQAIALEDSPNGVIAAQQAGIFCVAVPNPVTSQLSLLHADLCLSSLTEVSLEQLLAKVRGTVKHEHIH